MRSLLGCLRRIPRRGKPGQGGKGGSFDLSYTDGPGMGTVTPLRAMVLGLGAVALVAGSVAPRAAAAGTIKGTVALKGTTPELKKLAVTIDQYVCGKEKNPEDLVLSPQGGIRSAVVWIEKPPAGAPAAALAPTAAMDQKDCVFAPRVVVVPAGGAVDFLSTAQA